MASPGLTLPGRIVGVLTYIMYMERSRMAHDTRVMFGQSREGDDVDYGYKDAGAAQIFKDQNDVNSLREQFQQFHVFDYIKI